MSTVISTDYHVSIVHCWKTSLKVYSELLGNKRGAWRNGIRWQHEVLIKPRRVIVSRLNGDHIQNTSIKGSRVAESCSSKGGNNLGGKPFSFYGQLASQSKPVSLYDRKIVTKARGAWPRSRVTRAEDTNHQENSRSSQVRVAYSTTRGDALLLYCIKSLVWCDNTGSFVPSNWVPSGTFHA
jgi:hypothetical protein